MELRVREPLDAAVPQQQVQEAPLAPDRPHRVLLDDRVGRLARKPQLVEQEDQDPLAVDQPALKYLENKDFKTK